MKNKLKNYFLLVSVISIISLSLGGEFFAGKAKNEDKKNTVPALQGKQAIERLKQNGAYDSLAEAVRQVSGENERPEATAQSFFKRQAKLLPSDSAAYDFFGVSVAVSVDTAVVGAYGSSAAYVFVRSGATWTQQAKLTASDGSASSHFGASVSISGETIIVGANGATVGSNAYQGAAYIFARHGSTWTQQAKLTASDGAADDGFGYRVAISDSNAIVSAYADDVGSNSNQGSAYTFVRSGTVWTEEQKITAAGGATNDEFGWSVALSNVTAIVGSLSGSSTIFVRSGNTWNPQRVFPNGGRSVAVSGNTAAVLNNNQNPKSVAIYVRSGTTWTLQQELSDPSHGNSNSFGVSIALSGDTIVIGDPNDYQSSALVFVRSGTTWTAKTRMNVSFGSTPDAFGNSVGVSGDTLIVGAPWANGGGATPPGAAYIFTPAEARSPFDFDGDNKTDISIFRPSVGEWWYSKSSNGGNYAAQFGNSADKIVPGDYTGDGKTDIAVWRATTGEWLILRSEDASYYSFPFGTNGDVPIAGDFDGDGIADNAIYRPSSLSWYIRRSMDGGTTIQQFGASADVPVAADYDGDGKTDLAIWRPSVGQWWINRSLLGTVAFAFGNSFDKPVQGDYTGDGKADVAIFRPASGEWFVLRSEDNSFYSFPFGVSTDVPAPGDYDGDRKTDATVFRPSNSTWYVQRTTAGTLIQSFGNSGDKPVPNAFVP